MPRSRSCSLTSWIAIVGLVCLSIFTTSCSGSFETPPGRSKSGSGTQITGDPRFAYVVNNRSETLSVYAVTHDGADLQPLTFAETGPAPVHVSVSPDGSLVVVCNYGASDVSVYDVDAVTGLLDQRERLTCGSAPVASVFHPSGRYFYVANSRSDGVSKFEVDATDGTITRISQDSNAGGGPQALVLSPDGSRLYMINSLASSLWTYEVDDVSGDLRPIHSVRTGFVPLGMTLAPGGHHLYVVGGLDRGRLLGLDLDAQTGKPSPMVDGRRELGLATVPVSAQVGAAGRYLYVALRRRGELLTIPLATTTGVPGEGETWLLGGESRPEALFLQSGGERLLLVDSGSNEVQTVDLTTRDLPSFSQTTPAMRTQDQPLSVAYGYGAASSGFHSTHAFVANSADGTLSAYAIDDQANGGTGRTSELAGSPVTTGNLPTALALHPDGQFVYAAGRVGISVHALVSDRLEPRKGILLGDHVDLVMGRRGRFVYAVEGGSLSRVQPYAIDPLRGTLASGELPFVATGRFSSRGALDPTGRFLYVPNTGDDTISSFVVDARTGRLSAAIQTGTGSGPAAVVVHPSGRWAYVILTDGGEIAQMPIDPVTGLLGTGSSYSHRLSTSGSRPVDLAIDPDGRRLYVADPERQRITFFRVDESSGYLVEVSTHEVYKPVRRVRVDASGRFLLATYDNGTRGGLESFAIDALTGSLGSSSTSLTGRDPRSITMDRRRD